MGLTIKPSGQTTSGSTKSGQTAVRVETGNAWLKIGEVVLSSVKWLGIAMIALLAAILLAISIIWGPTPLYLALPLAAAWLGVVAFLALGTSRYESWRVQLSATLGFFVLGLLALITSQLFAYTPAIVDAQGRAVPGSIATLETVRLGGSDQWISIQGENIHNPVLLWLAGGPGGSQLATERYHLGGLEYSFVAVNWEQPGSGKSYDAVPHSQLTTERYISDGYALVQYLKARFGVEKVYLAGEPWGSALGVWLVQQYPDQFCAFAGTGQMVDFVETEVYDYNFSMQLAVQRGDSAKIAQLKAQGPPPYYTKDATWKQTNYMMDGFNYMNDDPAIDNSDGFNTFQDILCPEYGLYDKVNWARGILDSGNVMFPQLWKADVDFRRNAPSLNIPVYFLVGRRDVNAPPTLAEEYYRMLRTPHKEWVWFERSGHGPWVTEPKAFVDVLVNRVLQQEQVVPEEDTK